MRYVIGIDIGGTNTDGVLVDDQETIIDATKTPTTDDISIGFSTVLQKLLVNIAPKDIEGIFIGTTHATNAILQAKDLYRVGVIRIAGQKPDTLPVGFAWPQNLKTSVIAGVETINGGFECHGGAITPFSKEEATQAIKNLLEKNVESLAVIGVFAPLNGEHENEVASLIKTIAGFDFPVSLSHEIGGIGFIERENSTVLNASLKRVMKQGFEKLQIICKDLGLTCSLMITQNDGSLITMSRAINYPVLTISAGPTNSFIGGVKLARLNSAIVIDIGGTSTDIGVIQNGFPLRSVNVSNIGGVFLNFPMPDVFSIALGGGSFIHLNEQEVEIGPESAAKHILKESFAFGGNRLTLTDAALLLGHHNIPNGNPNLVPIHPTMGLKIFNLVKKKIETLLTKIRKTDLPIIFVGGGAALLPLGLIDGQTPKYFDVANAYGAALAEISGTIDTIVSLKDRDMILKELLNKSKQIAIDNGANPSSLRLVDQQIIPYHYVPNQMARVIIRVSGKRISH